MMSTGTLSSRIETFVKLGNIVSEASGGGSASEEAELLRTIAAASSEENPWFTPRWVNTSLSSIASWLTLPALQNWISAYPLPMTNRSPRRIGVIMAGNIPLVGFHDMLSVLLCGHHLAAHLSSKDSKLPAALAAIISDLDPELGSMISFDESSLGRADAIIATGSDNSSRYFDYLYGSKPHIFRKNRNSVAIITNSTTREEITRLGEDVFSYYGLGCRNVARLWLPTGFDLSTLASCWKEYRTLMEHGPYSNNYRYQRALAHTDSRDLFDTGFLLLEEKDALNSPVALLYYTFYNDTGQVERYLETNSELIQAVAGGTYLPFGSLQYPALEDYADGVDTIQFLLGLE